MESQESEKREPQESRLKELEDKAYKLEERREWQQAVDIWLAYFNLSPNSRKASYNLAVAYEKTGQLEQAQEYYQITLSHSSLDPLYKDIAEKRLRKIETVLPLIKNVPGVKPSFIDRPQTELDLWNRLFLPELVNGEAWISPQSLADIVQTLTKQKCVANLEDAKVFCHQCWDEIESELRRYQISSQGRVEVLATEKLSQLIGLKLVRFIQEGARAPQVFLRFTFGEPSVIGVVKVKADGSTVGFQEASESDLFKAIIETTALAYYRDLVIPSVRYYRPSGKRRGKTTSGKPSTPRPLPRVRRIPLSEPLVYRFDEWHEAQQRARHHVVGHIRWVREGFRADWIKQEQAWRAGVRLPLGYTWVIEHERGGGEPSGPKLDGTDLAKRTRFLPPERASHTLNRLFVTPEIH